MATFFPAHTGARQLNKSYVPEIERDVVQKIANEKYHGDTEKVPTTTARSLTVKGVAIESRYDKADEYNLLAEIVDGLPTACSKLIDGIFCDSKATKVYCATLKHCSWGMARQIGYLLSEALVDLDGGFNGLHITGQAGGSIDYHPCWPGNPDEDLPPCCSESVRRH
ncbi:hypothetical protein ABWH98_24515 [Labrenzia sp. ac12]